MTRPAAAAAWPIATSRSGSALPEVERSARTRLVTSPAAAAPWPIATGQRSAPMRLVTVPLGAAASPSAADLSGSALPEVERSRRCAW